tara:strand:- start:20570 stop:21622 length:1053 start_codon:yes stop_codon:yes gene_type:complete
MTDYLNIVIKRQAILERIKSGLVGSYNKELEKLNALIKQALLGLEGELSDTARGKVEKLLRDLRGDLGTVFKGATDALLSDLPKVAALNQAQEIAALVETSNVTGTLLEPFAQKRIFAKVVARPLATNGGLLDSFIDDFSKREVKRISDNIRFGALTGRTNQQIVKDVLGTAPKSYKDGSVSNTRRHAATMVRTSTQHVASAARQEVWEGNPEVVKGYTFVATLDTTTSAICRSLDKKEFEVGTGPVPPVHPNCRSTTAAVLDDKFKFLSKGRTRSSAQGPVAADVSFYDWLKGRPEAEQKEVLGAKRAELFKNMSAGKFRDLQFDKNFQPLTLEEMRILEPAAFKKAGI